MKLMFGLLIGCATVVDCRAQTGNCYDKFFARGTALKNTSAVTVTVRGKAQKLTAFLAANYIAGDEEKVLLDVDRDGSKELVLHNFTGGAHCCDEWYFFKNTAPNRYELTAKLFAGNTCVTDSVFVFDFHESFGYFFTCYACELEKSGKPTGLQAVASVNLRYANGKMTVLPGDETLRQRILKNLQYLKKLGWDGGVKEGDFDDGRRKELAFNLAVYHFSFGQNPAATKSLFTTHYLFKDAAAVWKEFAALLNSVKNNMGL